MASDPLPADTALSQRTIAILDDARTQKYAHSLPKKQEILVDYPSYVGETTVWYSVEGIILGVGAQCPPNAHKLICDSSDLYAARFCVDNDGIAATLASPHISCGTGHYYNVDDFAKKKVWFRNMPVPVHVLLNDIIPQITDYRNRLHAPAGADGKAGPHEQAVPGAMPIDIADLERRVQEQHRQNQRTVRYTKDAVQYCDGANDAVAQHQRTIHDEIERRRQARKNMPADSTRNDHPAYLVPQRFAPEPGITFIQGLNALIAGMANYVKNQLNYYNPFHKGKFYNDKFQKDK